jgi:hypothetical protein
MRSSRQNVLSRVSGVLALLAAASVAPLWAVACAEEGETPSCPEQKLYDITDPNASRDPAVEAARKAGIDAGCTTPIGSATSGTLPGSGGSGGGSRSGSGGSAGETGSAGDAGSAGGG